MTRRASVSAAAALMALALPGGCQQFDAWMAPSSEDELDVGVEVPSQEEADAAAAQSIDQGNADDELEKLNKEISADEASGN